MGRILKSEQEWTLPGQIEQPKTGQGRKGLLLKFICGAPTTVQGYGIDQNRIELSDIKISY